MTTDARVARRKHLLLVEPDLGRRVTVAVAVAVRYMVRTAVTATEAIARAAGSAFDVALLDASVLGAQLPAVVRALRARGAPAIVVLASRRDFRARHFAATLHVDAVLGRRAPLHAVLDRIARLSSDKADHVPIDRLVARAIDLMARDVINLLHVDALAHATGVGRAALADRFRMATDMTVDQYVRSVLVAVAEQLLHDTSLGIETLAHLLGFGDARELARAFSTGSPA